MPSLKPVFAAIAALLTGCVAIAPPPPLQTIAVEQRDPVTILVSIDGFRPDYLDRGVTPVMNGLKAKGVFAAMRPSFPSKTFPNHWAMVTGMRPDRSGIVANTMEDTARPGEKFTMATDDPFWWNAAPPIWVDAEKAGIRTATEFWPGSNVAWGGSEASGAHHAVTGGTRPEDWGEFNQAIDRTQRVNTVLDWLRRPAGIRPKFMTLYFDTVDSAGHDVGPNGAATTAAVADVDGAIGQLVDGLAALRQPANLVIVSDHGMAETSPARVVPLAALANPADFRVVEDGVYASLAPTPGHEAKLARELARPHAHVQCWPKTQIPARLHYGHNPRVPPYLCLAELGWLVTDKPPKGIGGNHGYDNDAPDMRALFLAAGPAFRAGATLPVFDNVDVDPLLRDLIGLSPAQGIDGNDAPFRGVLK